MDQDQFNDFEESPPPSEPQQLMDPPQHPPTRQSITLEEVSTEQPLPEISMQPSYSMVTNVPSQLTFEMDSLGGEAAAWPGLTKMESDHSAVVGHMELDFSKRNSQGELSGHPPDYSQPLFLPGEHSEPQSNLSNAPSLNSQPFSDFDFAITSDNSTQPTELTLTSAHLVSETAASDIQSATEVTFQNAQVTQMEQAEVQPQHKESDEFDDFHQAEVTARKESEEFQFQSAVEPSPPEGQVLGMNLALQGDSPTIEMEKGVSLESNYSAVSEDKDPVFIQSQTLVQENPIFQEEPIFQKGTVHHEEPVFQEEPTITYEPAVQEETVEVGSNQVTEAKQEQIVKQMQQQEEDDEFGDFQETVKATPGNVPGEVLVPEGDSAGNRVRIEAQRAPAGMQINSRQKQLQEFVEGLPDYSFLLGAAFNSL